MSMGHLARIRKHRSETYVSYFPPYISTYRLSSSELGMSLYFVVTIAEILSTSVNDTLNLI